MMLEGPTLLLELLPPPLLAEELRDTRKVRLELGRERKVEGRQAASERRTGSASSALRRRRRGKESDALGKARDAKVKVQDMVLVAREDLAQQGRLADTRCAEEGREGWDRTEGALDGLDLAWAVEEAR